ncbi:MAG: hypothetical protein Q8M06_00275 [Methanobacteriaceae archaeon]|nr:hypothetical protein [Methanobacteriaceae archaeon]
MNDNKQFFSIQNKINFVINEKNKFKIFDTLYKHYENFKTPDKLSDLDLIFNLGKFTPKTEGKYVVGYGKYYIGSDYLYVANESYKGANWSFEILGIEDKTTIVNIDFNTYGRIFITGHVIDFLIHLKLLQKDNPIIHASGISKKESCTIFSARGGGGKTSIALESLNQGYGFLGDNYLIVNQDEIFSFPTSLSLFTYNLADIILKKLKTKEKVSISLKNLLYKISNGYAKFFTKINPFRITEVIPKSNLQNVFILQPNVDKEKKIIVNEIDREIALKKIYYNQMLEFTYFNQYMAIYSYLFPEKNLSKHWDMYFNALKKNISENINFYEVSISGKQNFDEIFHKINDYL